MTDVRHGASRTDDEATRSPEDMLHRVIEPGERVIWSGRPDVDAMVQGVGTGRMGSAGALVAIATTAAGIWLLGRRQGVGTGGLVDQLTQDGAWVYVLVAVAIMLLFPLVRIAGVDLSDAKQHRRWAGSLTYGITDRRLLILESDEIVWECGPDDLGPIRLRERTPTRGDLVFKERPGGGRRESVHARDRRRIGFLAMPEPERIEEVVERWRDAHRTAADRQVASFLEAPVEWGADAEEGSAPGRTVRNARYGLVVTFPDTWEIRVRTRGAPYGKVALEFEKWQLLDESTDWNVIRAEGPYHASVEIHLDVVPEPVITLAELSDSWLHRAFAGEQLHTDDAVRWGRFTGFSATRRHLEHLPDQSAGDAERPALIRSTFLHDGRLQVGITVTWPEGSETLEAVVDKIVQEMTLTELDTYQVPPPVPSEAAKYLGRLFVAGRIVRVFMGLPFFAAGVWSGYVEAMRVAESGGSGSSTWMIPAIGGLIAMLRPLALPFEAFRGFTHAPFGKRVLMTVGLSVGIVLLIGALFP